MAFQKGRKDNLKGPGLTVFLFLVWPVMSGVPIPSLFILPEQIENVLSLLLFFPALHFFSSTLPLCLPSHLLHSLVSLASSPLLRITHQLSTGKPAKYVNKQTGTNPWIITNRLCKSLITGYIYTLTNRPHAAKIPKNQTVRGAQRLGFR